jgi:hypothetical protein
LDQYVRMEWENRTVLNTGKVMPFVGFFNDGLLAALCSTVANERLCNLRMFKEVIVAYLRFCPFVGRTEGE